MESCTVRFILNSSHDTNEIGYYSCSEYKIIDKDNTFGEYVTEISISNGKILKDEIEKVGKIASIALAKNERNPSDACPFFSIDWKSIKIESEKNRIKDFFTMKITRNIELKEIQNFINCIGNYSIEMDFFYYGLMSNNAKAKFFHFFTILEYHEDSDDYKKQFANNSLFSNEEKEYIKNFIELFDDRKKGVICKSLSMTKLNRAEKLFHYLKGLNLECINAGKINFEDIRIMINQRNKLYHSSGKFNCDIVYDKLFPLAKELVIKKLKNE